MSNINVRVVGTANLTQMGTAYAKAEAQVAALNRELAQMVALQNGVDPTGYQRMARAAADNSKAFRSAAASTGMFEVQQLKVNRATDGYIERLQKQQMGFRELHKQRKIASAAYKEQLAMENMMVRQQRTGTIHGKSMLDVVYPNQFSRDMDTASKRLSFFNDQLKSGAHQMVNWGKNTQWAGRQMMVGLTMPMLAFGAAAGVMAYKVDKELTRIAKVYDTTADATDTSVKGQMALERELMKLREDGTATAIKAAREYGSAGEDTLNVQAELAATGQRGVELQRATAEVMRISRLGEIEHQDAINTTIALQSVFKMSTDELTDSFNYMNSVENATSLQTKDFAQAIPIAAAPIQAFGGDIQELGTALVAMKQNGIEATQGANAIKAAMQRLGRPSKQIQEEWTALTNTDITKIFDEADGFLDLFSKINDATKDLDKKEKIKAFAGLFGTYQVTRMKALVQGVDDLEKGVGQVSRANELAGASTESWADTAEAEMKRYRESISGQFDAAKNELMLQLSTLGEPFVVLATHVMNAISAIIEKFNELPGVVKYTIAGFLGVAAVIGPIVMITGVMANLLGTSLKGLGVLFTWISKFTGGMKIATAMQRAAAMEANLHTTALTGEARAADLVTMSLTKMTQAMAASNSMTMGGTMAANAAAGRSTAATSGLATASMMGMQMRGMTPSTDITAITGQTDKIAKNSDTARRNWKGLAGYAGVAAVAGSAMLMSSEGMVGNIAEIVFYAALLGPMLAPLGGPLKAAAAGAATQFGKGKAAAVGLASSLKAGGGFMSKLVSGVRLLVGGMAAVLGSTTFIVAALAAGAFALYKWYQHEQKINEQERAYSKAISSRTNLLSNSLDIQIKKQKELNTLQATGTSTEGGLPSSYDLSKELMGYEEGRNLVNAYKEAEGIEKSTIATQKYQQVLEATGGNALKARRYVEALFTAAGDGALMAQSKALSLMQTIGSEFERPEQLDLWENLFEINIQSDNMEAARQQGTDLGKQLADAMAAETNHSKRLDIFEGMNLAADRGFRDLFNSIDSESRAVIEQFGVRGGKQLRDLLQNYRAVVQEEMTPEQFGELYGRENFNAANFNGLASVMARLNEQVGPGLESLKQTEAGIVRELSKQLGIKYKIYSMDELILADEFEMVTQTKKQAQAAHDAYATNVDNAHAMDALRGSSGDTTQQMKLQDLNLRRVNQGLQETGTLSDGFGRATTHVNGELRNSGRHLDENNNKLRTAVSLATSLAGAANALGKADFVSAAQSGMAGVQQDIADMHMDAFQERMDTALERRQSYWDNRSTALSNNIERETEAMGNLHERQQEAMTSSHERQENALSNRHESQQRAMDATHERQTAALDAKWERRTDAATAYWDNRIKAVDRAIEAEQRAEELRQKMFDAEISRINKLNEMANRSIDFNVALNEGNFDEAARIRNDAQAGAAQSALEAAAAAGSSRSERRINRLEKRKGHIETARDKAMEALERQAEAEKAALQKSQERQAAHLQKVQERQAAHLKKIQEMKVKQLEDEQEKQATHLEKSQARRERGLQREADADMETQRDIWESRKLTEEEKMELFLAFIAKNERQLKAHMKRVGLDYHVFGRDVLKPKGEEWSKFFGDRLQHHIRTAGLELASDKMWERLGKGSINGLLKGMGFNGMGEFRNFINTGKFGGGSGAFGNNSNGNRGSGGQLSNRNNTGGTRNNANDNMGGITRHTGGFVDEGPGSRKGVARTLRGLHSNEALVRAQKGEYIVNKDDAQRNASTLEAINSGANTGFDAPSKNETGIGGAGPGIAGLMAGVVNKAMVRGVGHAMTNAYDKKMAQIQRQQARLAGAFGMAGAGKYGDRYFNAAQMRNASTIASVGERMGMSERDIMIGIMTAITESGLVNVRYGDRDSLGLFQQRPSMGWGTPAQVTNPEYAAGKFFSGLKGIVNRGAMSPWMAAQSVQRSAFPTGSNYRIYWDEANAIWKAMEAKGGSGGRQYAAGPGGWRRPAPGGRSWRNSHDYGVGIGTPLYAVSDGTIVESRAIRSGGSSTYPGYPRGYTSYGETLAMRTQSGDIFRYAHLQPGTRKGTGAVKGGTMIGRSGMTGNASGPHVHFDVNGNYDARGWLQRHGVGLKTGASNIRWDNTIANLHKGEAVLTEPLNRKFHEGVNNFANGGETTYNINVYGADGQDVNALADAVMTKIERREGRKPGSRKR